MAYRSRSRSALTRQVDQLLHDVDWFDRITHGRLPRMSDRRLRAYRDELTQRLADPVGGATGIGAPVEGLLFNLRAIDAECTRLRVAAAPAESAQIRPARLGRGLRGKPHGE
jgi:hypothetical protein